MVDGMTLLNFNVVILHNLLRTVSAFVDELVPQDNRVSCILHISLNILRGHLASTTCEPFVEEVTLQTTLCHQCHNSLHSRSWQSIADELEPFVWFFPMHCHPTSPWDHS